MNSRVELHIEAKPFLVLLDQLLEQIDRLPYFLQELCVCHLPKLTLDRSLSAFMPLGFKCASFEEIAVRISELCFYAFSISVSAELYVFKQSLNPYEF